MWHKRGGQKRTWKKMGRQPARKVFQDHLREQTRGGMGNDATTGLATKGDTNKETWNQLHAGYNFK